MRYRALDVTGDFQFGRAGIFLQDSSACVAQAILTRLKLWTKEWPLDLTEGTSYDDQILGHGTQGSRDIAIKQRIVETQGVIELVAYQSSVSGRVLTVSAKVNTQFGSVTITAAL